MVMLLKSKFDEIGRSVPFSFTKCHPLQCGPADSAEPGRRRHIFTGFQEPVNRQLKVVGGAKLQINSLGNGKQPKQFVGEAAVL